MRPVFTRDTPASTSPAPIRLRAPASSSGPQRPHADGTDDGVASGGSGVSSPSGQLRTFGQERGCDAGLRAIVGTSADQPLTDWGHGVPPFGLPEPTAHDDNRAPRMANLTHGRGRPGTPSTGRFRPGITLEWHSLTDLDQPHATVRPGFGSRGTQLISARILNGAKQAGPLLEVAPDTPRARVMILSPTPTVRWRTDIAS